VCMTDACGNGGFRSAIANCLSQRAEHGTTPRASPAYVQRRRAAGRMKRDEPQR